MGRKRRGPAGAKSEVVMGRSLITITASSMNVIQISPNSAFPRALAIADVFQFYRFKKLRVNLCPGTELTAGYAPGAAFDTPPTTSAQVIELPVAILQSSAKTTDTVLNVPQKELLNDAQIPWYKTIPGVPSTEFEIQGNLYILAGSGVSRVYIDYAVEFQSWNLAAQSPLFKNTLVPQETSGVDDRQVVINGQKFIKVGA